VVDADVDVVAAGCAVALDSDGPVAVEGVPGAGGWLLGAELATVVLVEVFMT